MGDDPENRDDSRDDRKGEEEGENYEDDDYWSPAVEDIRWDAMFQNLKPT